MSKKCKKVVQNVLMEMEKVLSEYKPNCVNNPTYNHECLYDGEMIISGDTLCTHDFMIGYQDGSFLIFFRFNTCPVIIAQVMKTLSPKFKVEVGEPFYPSNRDRKFYWGCECMQRFVDELEYFVKNQPIDTGALQRIEKDDGLKN